LAVNFTAFRWTFGGLLLTHIREKMTVKPRVLLYGEE